MKNSRPGRRQLSVSSPGFSRSEKSSANICPSPGPTIVWFRHDLRLEDNPALAEAARRGRAVIPLFIWAPEEEGHWPPGAASRLWMRQSLQALDRDLRVIGSRLVVRRGPTLPSLRELLAETGAHAVLWNRRYEPAAISRDEEVKRALLAQRVEADSFNAALLHEPWDIHNQAGKPFQVFTAYWRHCLRLPDPPEPEPAPRILHGPKNWPPSLNFDEVGLGVGSDWTAGLQPFSTPGTRGATAQLERFLANGLRAYAEARDQPASSATSRLSPHLHFGEISPRRLWHAVKHACPDGWRTSKFLTELGWREFAHHLLYHFPHTERSPLRSQFQRFVWRKDPSLLESWQQGRTGYPLVDAGMRALQATGWMHNRARMLVASFLVKDLLISWQEGARWFWDRLVDADLAQNTLGWQWAAGCGADAAPFFRIFNPAAQGAKFDPQGEYVRRWVPELAALPHRWIHQPHKAPSEVLSSAGVELGRTYPEPVVNHAIAREVALERFARLKSTATTLDLDDR